MKTSMLLAALAVLCAGAAADDAKVSVSGEYLEARTCDVWTGPCFSNSEYGITGNQAVLVWSVEKGAWNGTRLDGLKVAAVLCAEGTLQTAVQGRVKSVVYLDRAATEEQGKALLALARSLASDHLRDVVRVARAEISFARTSGTDSLLTVGKDARIRTGALSGKDCICGNEEQAYEPLSAGTDVDCVKSLELAYSGGDLGARWNMQDKRSGMVGRFSR